MRSFYPLAAAIAVGLSVPSVQAEADNGMMGMDSKQCQEMHAKCMGMMGKDMDMGKCMEMHGKQMKGMSMDQCMQMVGKDGSVSGMHAKTHKGSGTVTKVDRANGKVTIAHGPIASLNWPAMTMGFAVKDKKLLDKLSADKKVDFELEKQGSDYVVTAVK